jgi:para-nitrobenzyl esterase
VRRTCAAHGRVVIEESGMMTPITSIAAGFAAVVMAGAAHAQPGPLVVRTDAGQVRGQLEGGVASWKGVPFAQPPVGALRWRAPQPATPWSDVHDATRYSHDCMQKPFPSDAAPLGTEPAEDCLYLNVWKPAHAAAPLPVLVWIYGGGFVNGGASPPTYSGANIARKGVLFVSFNYRLGRFGTFALPELTRENPDGGRLGNYGLMDQIAALQWVRRNIAAFGGDPAKVTIVGESAGGMSVHDLLTSPETQGLFRGAVIMSGGDGRSDPTKTLADAERVGQAFARSQGIDPGAPDALTRLRGLSASQIVDGFNLMSLLHPAPGPATYTGPFADGTVAVDLGQAYASGRFAHVPVIVGATSADMGGRTGFMVAGARHVAGELATQGVPTWEYRFSYVASSIGQPGAQHASDIPFFFDTEGVKYGAATTARDTQMGRQISRYLVNFVQSGDPNGPGSPGWPRYSRAADQIMDFSASGTATPQRDPWTATP